ncbi:hypothetical protein LCGC14_0820420 [marine sediment metagenome]|uniref:N-acetyltransferase domain-containing protein n=1 Tax=marine sediment metagenome TaxID=412755 RepID=A0A0F9PNP5_9ZZZZ
MKIKIIDFHPAHLDLMDIRDHEVTEVCVGDYKQKFTVLSKLGVSGTVIYDGEILCVIGAFDMWKSVCEVWILPSKAIGRHKLIFARLIKQQLEALEEVGNYHRIQVSALDDEFHNKFFTWLGFDRETPNGMKNFTKNKSNYNLWSKTK